MTRKQFTIDKVSWHTLRPGNPDPPELTIRRFYNITKFLQDNNLTVRTIMRNIDDVDDEFELKTEDLTEEGFALMKGTYEKWLRKFDRTGESSDMRVLERALKTLREGKSGVST